MPTRTRRSIGFTLIEMLVVIVILALLLGLMIPRLGGREKRAMLQAAEQVADLMVMYAQRDQLSTKPVSLSYHPPPTNMLELVVLDRDETNPSAPPLWKSEPFAPPVTLPEEIVLQQPRVDGLWLSEANWAIISAPGMPRPMIEITLSGYDMTQTVMLAPNSTSPRLQDVTGAAAVDRTPIDLDLAGRGREEW